MMAVPRRVGAVNGGQQTASGGHEPGAPGQEVDQVERPGFRAAVKVEGDDEVERSRGQVLVRHVEDDAADPLLQAASTGLGLHARDRGGGQVEADDVPAALGEPDGVGALTAAQIEGAPRLPGVRELGQPVVGVPGPQPVDGGITRFPLLLALTHAGETSVSGPRGAPGSRSPPAPSHPRAARILAHRPRPCVEPASAASAWAVSCREDAMAGRKCGGRRRRRPAEHSRPPAAKR